MFNPIEVFERVRRPATASVNYCEDKARFVSGRFASAVASGAARWNQLSRATRFVVAACVVFVLTMILLAAWLSSSVESALVQNSITRTLLYTESVLAPQLQALATREEIDDQTSRNLESILGRSAVNQGFAAIRVMNLKGKILFSTSNEIGQSVARGAGFAAAVTNEVAAGFQDLAEAGNREEQRRSLSLFRVYAPVRAQGTGRVIGVAAIDQSGELLRGDIQTARWKISLIFGFITLVMIALISAVGVWPNAMLKSQRQRLELQTVALATLVQRTGELEEDLIAARTTAGQISERLLRRVGADLHDGPAQLMGLALLFFDGLKPLETSKQDAAGLECVDTKSNELFETVRRLIRDALGELRNISRDIAPPELAALSTCDVVMLAVSNHQRRTGIAVGRDFEVLPAELSPARKTCVYRFVQEGLSNSYRHAKGAKVFVATRICGSVLSIEVADQGPGFDPTSPRCVSKLGIAGLKDRIACNGGTLELISSVGGGTRLMAHFTLHSETEQPTI